MFEVKKPSSAGRTISSPRALKKARTLHHAARGGMLWDDEGCRRGVEGGANVHVDSSLFLVVVFAYRAFVWTL